MIFLCALLPTATGVDIMIKLESQLGFVPHHLGIFFLLFHSFHPYTIFQSFLARYRPGQVLCKRSNLKSNTILIVAVSPFTVLPATLFSSIISVRATFFSGGI